MTRRGTAQAMSDATVYITSMRSNADVDVNPKLFE